MCRKCCQKILKMWRLQGQLWAECIENRKLPCIYSKVYIDENNTRGRQMTTFCHHLHQGKDIIPIHPSDSIYTHKVSSIKKYCPQRLINVLVFIRYPCSPPET